jgi:hypothetical protein
MNTLIVWQEVSENYTLYVVPNSIADNYINLLNEANGKLINPDEYYNGLSFLYNAIRDNVSDCDSEVSSKWHCVFAQYRVSSEKPIDTNISRVIMSGLLYEEN